MHLLREFRFRLSHFSFCNVIFDYVIDNLKSLVGLFYFEVAGLNFSSLSG